MYSAYCSLHRSHKVIEARVLVVDTALELVDVEEARGNGVSVEDSAFEGVDSLFRVSSNAGKYWLVVRMTYSEGG